MVTEAEFVVEYAVGGDWPCVAEITAVLPADKDGYLVNILRSAESFFGERLWACWGWCGKGKTTRSRSICLEASSWKELEEKVEAAIEDARATLREVVRRNEEFAGSKPADRKIRVAINSEENEE